jgi:hypothetical protein
MARWGWGRDCIYMVVGFSTSYAISPFKTHTYDQGSHTLVCHHLPGFFYYINFDSYDIAEQLVLLFVFDIPMFSTSYAISPYHH